MTRTELLQQIRSLVTRYLEIQPEELNEDTELGAVDVDSIDLIKLALAFERTFGVKVSPADVAQAQTLNDLLTALGHKLSINKEMIS